MEPLQSNDPLSGFDCMKFSHRIHLSYPSLATSLGLAAVVVDDGDPRLGVAVRRLLPLVLLRRHPQSLGATFSRHTG